MLQMRGAVLANTRNWSDSYVERNTVSGIAATAILHAAILHTAILKLNARLSVETLFKIDSKITTAIATHACKTRIYKTQRAKENVILLKLM